MSLLADKEKPSDCKSNPGVLSASSKPVSSIENSFFLFVIAHYKANPKLFLIFLELGCLTPEKARYDLFIVNLPILFKLPLLLLCSKKARRARVKFAYRKSLFAFPAYPALAPFPAVQAVVAL